MSALLVALAGPAVACGGFFCDGGTPIDTGDGNPWNNGDVTQTGEGVLFSVDGNTTTMAVSIAYDGDAKSFAWVVPLPAEPEIFLVPQEVFVDLQATTVPTFTASYASRGCETYSYGDADTDTDTDSDADADADADADTGSGAWVVAQAVVGPYQTTVLQATTTEALIDWLQANDYRVPDALANALSPYLTPTTNFLALRLNKDTFSGSLSPLGLRFAGSKPQIPIQLTQIAAADDMPVTVWFLGESRAVPLNYLHVEMNPLALPFFTQTPSWLHRLGEAADEAGMHAFMTTSAGYHADPQIAWVGRWDLEGLDQVADPFTWFEALPGRGFVADDELLAILHLVVPKPELALDEDFYDFTPAWYGTGDALTWRYQDDWAALASTFDPVAATDLLRTGIVEPRQAAQALFDANPYLTRLDSTLSPSEMTVDPEFGFNPDLPGVSPTWTADVLTTCDEGETLSTGSRTITFEPGDYTVEVPSALALANNHLAMDAWLRDRLDHRALVVEQMAEHGPPEILADYRSELDWTLAADDPESGVGRSGCGCSASRPVGAALAPLGLIALGRRKRRVPR